MRGVLQYVIDATAKQVVIPKKSKIAITDELIFVREAIDEGKSLSDRKKLKLLRSKLYAVIDAIYDVYEQYALPITEAINFGKDIGKVINGLTMPRSTPYELDLRDRKLAKKHKQSIDAAKVTADYSNWLEERQHIKEYVNPQSNVTENKREERFVKMLTKELYLQHKSAGVSEEKIVEKYKFKSPYYLEKWKESEGISKGDIEEAKNASELNCSDGFVINPKELVTDVDDGAVDVITGREEELAETKETDETQEVVAASQGVRLLVVDGIEVELEKRNYRLQGKDDYMDCVVRAATHLFNTNKLTSKQLIDALVDYK